MHVLHRPLLLFFLAHPILASGQWEEATEEYLIEATTQASWLGCGMSLADFNLDGLEDLTFANSDGTVVLYEQLSGGGFDLVQTLPGTEQAQGVAWFDADGDDDLDLLLTRRFASMELHIRLGDNLVEEASSRGLPINADWEGRGLSIADYDLDGDLDVYVCLYHDGSGSTQQNLLFNNNGDGFFSDVTSIAGVGNGVQHSFQAIWYDYDHDGDEDLWVVNVCTVYPNALYRNLGDGTFVDVAADLGANQTISGMTATAFDFDNDGDMELFCTDVVNEPNTLLDLVGDVFTESAAQLGVDGLRYSWGGCAVDADGDMWSDLMVATYRFPNSLPYDNYFYLSQLPNLGFEDVTEAEWPSEQNQLYCLGVCDVNQDLSPDVIGFGNMPFVQVLRNSAGDADAAPGRLVVRLCGTETNRFGVGAEIEVHAGGIAQRQFVSVGSDFMTQQSWNRYFGLANAAVVDSVVVRWRGGEREVWYDIEPNTTLSLIEGSAGAELLVQGTPCNGEVATLTAPFDAPVVRWNGVVSPSPSLNVLDAGTYVVECEWMGGLFLWTDTIEWDIPAAHGLTVEWTEPDCHGETGILGWLADGGLEVEYAGATWDTLVTDLPNGGGDVVFITTSEETGCSETHEFLLPEPTPLQLFVEYSPALCHDDVPSVLVSGYGGTPGYLVNWGGIDPQNLPEGTVPFTMTDANGCAVDSALEVIIPDMLICDAIVVQEDEGNDASIVLDIAGGTPPYSILWNDGTVGDTALTGLGQGVYSWVIEDVHGCLQLGVASIINVGTDSGLKDVELALLHEGDRLILTGIPEGVVQIEVLALNGQRSFQVMLSGESSVTLSRARLPHHGILRVLTAEGLPLFSRSY